MPDIATHHKLELSHHVRQGMAWLSTSNGGENTTALSYAALELRFAVERIAVHYWMLLLDRELEASDLADMTSFKTIERRIYELAGNQLKINKHFAFVRLVLNAMKIDWPLHTPKIGDLSRHWTTCSNHCHIAWPLSCADPETRTDAFNKLTQVADALPAHVESLGWPVLREISFSELREKFIAGEASEADVLASLQLKGIWAQLVYPDGREPHCVGEPIAPKVE